jgi:hypothetical protein
MASSKQRGFSLLEMMIVVLIGFTVAAVSVIALVPLMKQNNVTQPSPGFGTITVTRWDYAVPVSPAPVLVATFTLPQDVAFSTQAGYPSTATTVPDGFGAGTVPIDFDQGMGLGSQNYVMFMPDGSSQDLLGNWNSGVLYMGRAGDLYSSRAITVFGATGRIRGWRLYLQGVNTWVQQ